MSTGQGFTLVFGESEEKLLFVFLSLVRLIFFKMFRGGSNRGGYFQRGGHRGRGGGGGGYNRGGYGHNQYQQKFGKDEFGRDISANNVDLAPRFYEQQQQQQQVGQKTPTKTAATNTNTLEAYSTRDVEWVVNLMLVKLGQIGHDDVKLELALEKLVKLVLDADEHVVSVFMEMLIDAVLHQPHRAHVYGSLVGALNLESANYGKQAIEAIHVRLLALLGAPCGGEKVFFSLRILVRFLATLANCAVLSPSGLVAMFDRFLAVAGEDDVRPDRADAFVWIVLEAMPWVGPALAERKASAPELERILHALEAYIAREHGASNRLPLANVIARTGTVRDALAERLEAGDTSSSSLLADASIRAASDYDAFANFWQLLKPCFASSAHGSARWQPIAAIESAPAALQARFARAMRSKIGDVEVPAHRESMVYPNIGCATFRIFSADDRKSDTLGSGLDLVLAKIYVHDILHAMLETRQPCVEALMSLRFKLSSDSGAQASSSAFYDDGHGGADQPPVHLIVEGLFENMLRLPRAPNCSVAYAGLFCELLRGDASHNQAPIFERALNVLFHQMADLDPECVDRLVEWFSFHLCNVNLMWNWNEWNAAMALLQRSSGGATSSPSSSGSNTDDDESAARFDGEQQSFVRRVLAECIRLSYWKRVANTLPPDMRAHLLPPEPSPAFPYLDAEDDLSLELLTMMRKRQSGEELLAFLESEQTAEIYSDASDRLDVFVHTVLNFGSKTITHTATATSRYLDVFGALVMTQAHRVQILHCVTQVWRMSPARLIATVAQFLHSEIVDHRAIVTWLFADEYCPQLYAQHPWIILHDTLRSFIDSVGRASMAGDDDLDDSDSDSDIDSSSSSSSTSSSASSASSSSAKANPLGPIFQHLLSCLNALCIAEPQFVDRCSTVVRRYRNIYATLRRNGFGTIDTLLENSSNRVQLLF
jgi:MIF4G like